MEVNLWKKMILNNYLWKNKDSIAGFLKQHEGKITTDNSNIDIFVIPTDEEYMILKDTYDKCNLVKEKKAKTQQ